jgi:hypothetical protein
MLKNKYGFQVNISLSIFFIAFCDLFTDFLSYLTDNLNEAVCASPLNFTLLECASPVAFITSACASRSILFN